MATTTFEKTIFLDQKAAERLAEILEQPTPPHSEIDKDFWAENERKLQEWLLGLEK